MNKEEILALASQLDALLSERPAAEESRAVPVTAPVVFGVGESRYEAYPTAPVYIQTRTDMREISDYFERDSRRYDGGEELWS